MINLMGIISWIGGILGYKFYSRKIIIPIDPDLNLNMKAEDIIGVQPMTAPTGETFKLKKNYNKMLDEMDERIEKIKQSE